MAMHAGMINYPSLPKTGKLVRFMLDIEKSNSFLALAYKEGFEEWKKEQKKQATRKQPATHKVLPVPDGKISKL